MRAEFTDDLITGNELIDSQHEELIGRINKLLDSCEAGEGKISAIKMLDYLAKYTDTQHTLAMKKHFRKKPVIRITTNTMQNTKNSNRRFKS